MPAAKASAAMATVISALWPAAAPFMAPTSRPTMWYPSSFSSHSSWPHPAAEVALLFLVSVLVVEDEVLVLVGSAVAPATPL